MVDIKENIAKIQACIIEAARVSSRRPEDIKLMAVSKTRSVEEMSAAADFVDLFGENRIQEACLKRDKWDSDNDVPWHYIGRLQRNKARKALEIFDSIESVDSLDLARMLDRILVENGRTDYPVLLEINMSGEISKSGVEPSEAEHLLERILTYCPNLAVNGLMTIGPLTRDEMRIRTAFAGLRQLRERMRNTFELPLEELSMGMSGDFVLAIEEGSTIVRIGTAIFGSRV